MILTATLGWAAATGVLPTRALGQPQPVHDEVVVSAARDADAAVTAKVSEALRDDPYVFTDHVTVTVENGVVTLEGIVFSVGDLRNVLRLARRVAGKRRVINRLELVVADDIGAG